MGVLGGVFVLKSGLRILIWALQVPLLVPPKTQFWHHRVRGSHSGWSEALGWGRRWGARCRAESRHLPGPSDSQLENLKRSSNDDLKRQSVSQGNDLQLLTWSRHLTEGHVIHSSQRCILVSGIVIIGHRSSKSTFGANNALEFS